MTKKAASEAVPEIPAGPGKGHATPSRRDQETARKRPLVPADRKAAAKASRVRMQSERERARIGLANGDERFLPARDQGPQRRFARDSVDARRSVGELLFPVLALMLLASFVLPTSITGWIFVVMYAFIALMVVDGLFAARRIKARIAEKVGQGDVQRGLNTYILMRCVQMRFLRTPRPRVRPRDAVSF